jgi:hypothetical protein
MRPSRAPLLALRLPWLLGLMMAFAPARPLLAQDAPTALALARVVSADSTLQQPSTFAFQFGADSFTVAAGGAVTRGDSAATVFSLPLPQGARIERLYFGAAGGDLMLAWESTDLDGGSTSLGRYDSATFVARWVQRLSTMNTAPPLLAGSELYLGGLDFLARIDAASGDFIWQKNMLAPRGARAFQAFGSVRLDNGSVVFTEDVRGRPGRVIRAARADGTLLVVR